MSIALQITNECFTIPSAYSYWSYYSTVSSNIHSWCLLWFVFANTQTFFKQTTSTWKFSRHRVSLRSIKTQSRLRVVFVTKKRLVRREILSHCHIRDLVTLSFEIRNQATFCLSWQPHCLAEQRQLEIIESLPWCELNLVNERGKVRSN